MRAMVRTIGVGDFVRIVEIDADGSLLEYDGYVIDIPRDIGDWWHFSVDQDGRSWILALNPMSPRFFKIELEIQSDSAQRGN